MKLRNYPMESTETMETVNVDAHYGPFPHLIIRNFYSQEELDLIWEELNFYTKPGKLLPAKDYLGVSDYTDSKGLLLDDIYRNNSKKEDGPNYRKLSNILTVNRKIFDEDILGVLEQLHPCCARASKTKWDVTKVRYYHDGEHYEPHIDIDMNFLAFSYFNKEPKKYTGGELYFPEFDYEFDCENNSIIIFPGWVEHGVKKVSITDSEYFEGYGRYAITSFFGFGK